MKKGTESVGVKRQYTGTAGKVDNAQVGTFLSYVTEQGHAFLDRRLYLPEAWAGDPDRRCRAKVPEEVSFATKPEQARSMLEQAWASGVEMPWVVGDEVYGSDPALREAIAQSGRSYVLAVRKNVEVWVDWPALEEPFRETGGRPRTKVRVAPEAARPVSVAQLVESWPEARWERLAVAEGEKGPRLYDWGRLRVVEPRGGLPHCRTWLLARRPVADPTEVAYYLSNGTEQVRLRRLAEVASARYTVEQCIQEAKGQTGLDHYQVRHWHSWHRHITLSIMAHAFLASLRAKSTCRSEVLVESDVLVDRGAETDPGPADRAIEKGGDVRTDVRTLSESSRYAEVTVPEVRHLLEIALPLPPSSAPPPPERRFREINPQHLVLRWYV